MSIVTFLQSRPDALQKLSRFAGVSKVSSMSSPQLDQELPDVLDGVRHRTTDRERNTWYVSISQLDGNPVEIFASTAFDRDQHLQSRISNLTTITRLISLILRHIFIGERLTLEKTLIQLEEKFQAAKRFAGHARQDTRQIPETAGCNKDPKNRRERGSCRLKTSYSRCVNF